MYLDIKINCDNAAFVDNPQELADILHKAAGLADCASDGIERYLTDSNGNKVGTMVMTKN